MIANCILAAILGLAFGSFAVTCEERWYKRQSIIRPAFEVCPTCGHERNFLEKIPLVNRLVDGGRCHVCHEPKPYTDTLVELMMAAVFAGTVYQYGPTFEAAQILFCFWALTVDFLCDSKHFTLLDELLPLGVAFAAVGILLGKMSLSFVLIGAFVPGLCVLAFVMAFEWLNGISEALGGGDFKLLFFLGTVGGPLFAIFMFLAGNICLLLFFLWKVVEDYLAGKSTPFPLGVGIFLAFVLSYLFGVLPYLFDAGVSKSLWLLMTTNSLP